MLNILQRVWVVKEHEIREGVIVDISMRDMLKKRIQETEKEIEHLSYKLANYER